MFENRQLIWLLVTYALLQIASLYVGIFFFVYLIVYIMAIVSGSRVVYVYTVNNEHLKKFLIPFILFFLTNLILFLVYIPTLILNPNINWRLKGEYEVDPKMLQVYIPIVLFLVSLAILLLVGFVTRITRRRL